MHVIRHHEGRIKAQSEMAYDLILIRLILVFLQEFRRSGKRDLGNVLLHFVGRHADSVIDKFQGFLLVIHDHLNVRLVALRQSIFPGPVQLLQLRNSVTGVGNQLPHKNIMIRIHPFLDNRENIITVNRKITMLHFHDNTTLLFQNYSIPILVPEIPKVKKKLALI